MKKKRATFYLANGQKTEAFETDKGITLLHELGRVMQSDENVVSIPLMQEADQGVILFVRKEALMGVVLSDAEDGE